MKSFYFAIVFLIVILHLFPMFKDSQIFSYSNKRKKYHRKPMINKIGRLPDNEKNFFTLQDDFCVSKWGGIKIYR